ncbi:hypothetical protein [Haloprofundus sp. MHR1]|uniref:hypothetical protein n=1 Tax=Haloprofundus sp. MHR1 TaxID=2572921 RepID=UPI0010BE9A27|nr:hypothetical protein [Haloprofundus sp. MHR1]QCJ46021.1 hypothetical protein FCF25_02300 [Haloprofundus sp. MHR1]
MRRRQFLASAAALLPAAFGGCAALSGTDVMSGNGRPAVAYAPTASVEMTAVDDVDIAERITYELGPPDAPQHRFVADVVENGSTTTEGTEPEIPADVLAVYDGSVYQLVQTVENRQHATAYSVLIDIVQGSVEEDEIVRFEDLPAADREVFAARGFDEGEIIGIGTGLVYTDEQREASALVPEPEHTVIVWENGERARFSVDGSHEVELKTYLYTAETVAEDAAAYGREVRESHEFSLSGLSSAERSVVDEAVESEHGYTVPHDESPPEALVSLVDRFRPQDPVEGGQDGRTSGSYPVRYNGTVHWASLYVNESVFESQEDETSNESAS